MNFITNPQIILQSKYYKLLKTQSTENKKKKKVTRLIFTIIKFIQHLLASPANIFNSHIQFNKTTKSAQIIIDRIINTQKELSG